MSTLMEEKEFMRWTGMRNAGLITAINQSVMTAWSSW